jgi:hypothetical protein
MSGQRYIPGVRASIEQELTTLRQQLQDAMSAPDAASGGVPRGLPGAAPGTARPTEEIVTALDSRIARLEQVRDWIGEDEGFAALIDNIIGKQVRAATRWQLVVSFVLSVLFLIAGWLLSLLGSPADLLTWFR